MRLILTLSAALLLTAGSAMARVGFQGEAVITALAGAPCAAEGESVGAMFRTHLLPRGLQDNGPDTFISFYGSRNAYSLRLANSVLDSRSPYTAIYINSYGKHVTAPAGQVSAASVSPAPNPTAPFLNVRLTITNWNTIVGCTATLEGAFIRRR